MTSALHDAYMLGAVEHLPRDAGRAQIIEHDSLRGRAIFVEVGAVDLRASQVNAQHGCEILQRRHAVLGFLVLVLVLDETTLVTNLGEHCGEERLDRRPDRYLARGLGLRGFQLILANIESLVQEDVPVLEMYVAALERRELAGPRVEVNRESVDAPPAERDVLRCEEGCCFVWVEPLLAGLDAAIRPANAICGIVRAYAERGDLGLARIGEHLRYEPPHVGCRLPTEAASHDFVVKRFDDGADVIAINRADRLGAQDWEYVGVHSRAIGSDARESTSLSISEPALRVVSSAFGVRARNGRTLATCAANAVAAHHFGMKPC